MPFACRRAVWVFALLMSDSAALNAGPLARRPRPWRRRLLSQPSDDAAPARPKRFHKLLVPISVGGLAAVELSTSLWELGHHHGLAMLALSRGAHAVTDLTRGVRWSLVVFAHKRRNWRRQFSVQADGRVVDKRR